MTSSITWIDHDPDARDRTLRILSLFQERESRDELGLGAVRDAFSDALFPGTNTIQTRLRYMLFVPWIYTALESTRVLPPKFALRARQLEMDLIAPLLEGGDDAGIFGKMAGNKLKRLPSSVYWSGLRAWGIRVLDWSQEDYHRHVDDLYHQRYQVQRRHENDDLPDRSVRFWHPRLPGPPAGFPEVDALDFELTAEEASFLLDRLRISQGACLLTWLALHAKPVACDFPWEHPDRNRFPNEHRELLRYGEFFSRLMLGAALLYNLMLAEVAGRTDLEEQHRENLVNWRKNWMLSNVVALPLSGLWELTTGRGHKITPQTRAFVTKWHERVTVTGGGVGDDTECRSLVQAREQRLKGTRSRFTNARALDQWSGHAGTNPMSYRWGGVCVLLADLHAGLNRGRHA